MVRASIQTLSWPNETEFIQIYWKISVEPQWTSIKILLDVEINCNNRQLTYIEEDIQLSVLTPNSMILGRNVSTINSNTGDDSDEWAKRQRYIQWCKENTWKRWKHEYLVALWHFAMLILNPLVTLLCIIYWSSVTFQISIWSIFVLLFLGLTLNFVKRYDLSLSHSIGTRSVLQSSWVLIIVGYSQ